MYKCNHCGQRFYSTVDCEQHQEREHPETTGLTCARLAYRCGYCGATFAHQADVSNHALRDHGIQRVEVMEVSPV